MLEGLRESSFSDERRTGQNVVYRVGCRRRKGRREVGRCERYSGAGRCEGNIIAVDRLFERFKLALDKPLIVHSRKAEKECIELLENSRTKKVIMHCFCGARKLVERIQRNGWFLSIPTNVTYSQQFQQMAKVLPLTMLFCETDSPFLHPSKESNNEPALVLESYKTIALLKGLEIGEVAAAIARNYEKLFGK